MTFHTRPLRISRLVGVLAALAWTLAGCSSSGDGDSDSGSDLEVTADTVIVDVRTPEEFAEGHLEGAININLASGAFEEEIAELATGGNYVVYCRSGNRSAEAARIMNGLGFTDVTDAGGLEEAAEAAGLEIVTE